MNRRLRGFIEECDTVRAVNRLGGFSDEGGWPFCPLNQAQRAALQRIHAAHCDRPKPAEQQSSQAALRQLLKQGSSYGGPGELASFVRDQVSLPRNQGSPVSLLEILPEEERTTLEDFEAAMMLTPEERGAIIEKGLDNLCHMDPVLANSKKKYHQFVADMFTSGLIGFTTEPRSQIGAFVVTKKNGKQRLIVDARRTNRLFRTPPSTLLGSMECWGRLESDSEFFVAQEDVKDFFYRLGIPLELGRFFCFPCIDPHALQTEIGYMPEDLRALVHRDGRGVFPCMKVLPMGFSWAFHLAHQAHVEITKRALPRTPQIKDKAVMPRFGEGKHRAATGALIYADNNNHIGVQRQAVEQEHTTMLGALAQHGLDYHEVIEATSLAESLGVRIDGLTGRISATSTRDWRLHKALEALILRPSISGEEFQKIVGHLTIRAMMHRGLMSILRHVYTFIEQCYSQRTRLWQSVADELWLFKSLMVLGLNESFTPWDPWLLCTDASLTGYAVMESKYHMEDAGVIGRRDERWRFKKEKGKPRKAPREVALEGLDVFEDLRTVLPIVEGEVAQDLEVDSSFIDVDPKLLHKDNWKCLWRTPVRFKEPIHQIEARSILGAVKHRSRDSNKHSHRIVILNDNMGVCLAFQKGRCSNFGLLRIIRRVSAHLLCTGIRLSVRWVPSELNVADEDSRFWERSMGSGTKKFSPKEEGGRLHERVCKKSECDLEIGAGTPTVVEEKERSQPSCRHESPSRGRRPGQDSEEPQEEERESTCQKEEVCKAGSRREDAAGACIDQGASSEGLLQEARRVLCLRSEVRAEHPKRRVTGRSAVRIRGAPVSGRRRLTLWTEAASSLGVRQAGILQGGTACSSEVQEGTQGLEEACTDADPPSYARDAKVLCQRHILTDGLEGGGAVQRGDILDICQAWRDDEGDGRRCGRTEPGVQPCGHHPWTPRTGGIIESGHLRRSTRAGRQESSMVAKVGVEARTVAHEHHGGPAAVELQRCRVSQEVAPGRADAGNGGDCSEPISEPAWWSLQRSSQEAQEHSGDSTTRQVEHRQLSKDLRQAGSIATDFEPVRREVLRLRGRDAVPLRYLLPVWMSGIAQATRQSVEKPLQAKVFLSLFGGEAACAKWFCKNGGFSILVDFASSPKNDLSRASRWKDVEELVELSDFVGIDLPCNTWSRARRAPWWSRMPSALRDDAKHLFGFPWLKPRDAAKVKAANMMLRRTLKVIKRCLSTGKAGYLENPWSSRLWKVRGIKHLIRRKQAFLLRCDMCQYGTQWRKPTGV